MRGPHSDIDPPHILVQEGRYTSDIDFGDVEIGDPAYDFDWLWELGETFVDEVQESHYCPPENLKRREFRQWLGRASKHVQWGNHS